MLCVPLNIFDKFLKAHKIEDSKALLLQCPRNLENALDYFTGYQELTSGRNSILLILFHTLSTQNKTKQTNKQTRKPMEGKYVDGVGIPNKLTFLL